MNFDPRQLFAFVDRLAPRERLLLGLAVVSVVLIGSYTFIWDPLTSNGALLARKITARQKDLIEMQHQHDHYLDLLRQLEANQWVFEVDPSFNLLGYLQNVVSQAVTREKITSLNPTTRPRAEAPEFVEELVEIKLTTLDLKQIVDLMYRVEKGDHPLRFSRISIKKRFNDVHNFDVNAAVSVLKPTEKADKPGDKPAEHVGGA